MDNRLKEIRERLEKTNINNWTTSGLRHLFEIVEGQKRQLEDRLEDQTNACLMCDKMDVAMIEEENKRLKDREQVLREALQEILKSEKLTPCGRLETLVENALKQDGEL